MLLYHYTSSVNALLISGTSLKPKLNTDNDWQTMGVPVIWLTKETTNITTEAEKKKAKLDAKYLTVGEPAYGGPVRCIVEIERSKHLIRYEEFLRTTKITAVNPETGNQATARDLLRMYEENAGGRWKSWWICTRPIPISKIWIPLTHAQAIEACEWQIDKHPTPDGRECFKQQRDIFAARSKDTVFMFHDGKCKVGDISEPKAGLP